MNCESEPFRVYFTRKTGEISSSNSVSVKTIDEAFMIVDSWTQMGCDEAWIEADGELGATIPNRYRREPVNRIRIEIFGEVQVAGEPSRENRETLLSSIESMATRIRQERGEDDERGR